MRAEEPHVARLIEAACAPIIVAICAYRRHLTPKQLFQAELHAHASTNVGPPMPGNRTCVGLPAQLARQIDKAREPLLFKLNAYRRRLSADQLVIAEDEISVHPFYAHLYDDAVAPAPPSHLERPARPCVAAE